MRTNNLAFIDIEATGLQIKRHEIIEIGCVLVRQIQREGRGPDVAVIEEFEFKVKPLHIETADPIALQVNGYDPANWTSAVDLKHALEIIAEKTRDAIMVGHNVAFDHSFLEKAFEDTGVKNTMHYHKVDTISLAFALLYDKPEVVKFSLQRLCEYFKIDRKDAHTALPDARATFELYKKLLHIGQTSTLDLFTSGQK